MIGSETRIIVALRCTENRTPWRLAWLICSVRKASRAAWRITAASSTVPSVMLIRPLRTVTVPSLRTCSMRTWLSRFTVTDCSVERKSPSLIVATWERESLDHGPME